MWQRETQKMYLYLWAVVTFYHLKGSARDMLISFREVGCIQSARDSGQEDINVTREIGNVLHWHASWYQSLHSDRSSPADHLWGSGRHLTIPRSLKQQVIYILHWSNGTLQIIVHQNINTHLTSYITSQKMSPRSSSNRINAMQNEIKQSRGSQYAARPCAFCGTHILL